MSMHFRGRKHRADLPLRVRVFGGFLAVILVIGILTAIYDAWFVNRKVIGRAQREVSYNLKTAWNVYTNECGRLELIAEVLASGAGGAPDPGRIARAKKAYGLDYIVVRRTSGTMARKVFSETRIVPLAELHRLGPDLAKRSFILDVPTPMAGPDGGDGDVTDALAMEATACITGPDGSVMGFLTAGKLLNRNFDLVDRIRDILFAGQTSDGGPAGNVTIFLKDRRITTNVLTDAGERAIGTHLSSQVSDNVLVHGKPYVDRAFVVNDWYLTAYEPICDRRGAIVGVLYVGIREKPFLLLKHQMLGNMLAILLGAAVLCVFLSYWIAGGITRPLDEMISAVKTMKTGNLSVEVKTDTGVSELAILAGSFNRMASSLALEKEELLVANEKLNAANRNYLDMVGFVSHELKGIIGSLVMNVLSLKDGFLGPLNEKQARAATATARILEHFETMVKNYLDLSHLERGDLRIAKREIDLLEQVVQPSLAHFERECREKNISVETQVPEGLRITADPELLLVVCNNLVGNALKYGKPGGRIAVKAGDEGTCVCLSVFNEGTPIPEEKTKELFRRFSRLPGSEGIKGTGLGLFISRGIVEKHGGTIRIEPGTDGNTFRITLAKGEKHEADAA